MIREPRILLHRFKIIFQVGCLLIAIYFTTLFSAQYLENSDEQLINMKKFNEENDYHYPTFSLCFTGLKFQWYYEHRIFDSYGLNATQYQFMLKGETALRYDRNDKIRSYNKTQVFVDDGYEVDFNRFHLQVNDFIQSIKYSAENSSMDTLIEDTKDWNETMMNQHIHLAFQSPEKICYSRNSTDYPASIRLHDLITLNSNAIKKSIITETGITYDTQMEIFVHFPNHLIQSFGKAKYSTSFSHLLSTLIAPNDTTPRVLEFKLSECKRLKKRAQSNDPCSDQIANYDQYLQQEIEKHVGCAPTYIKQFLSTDSNVTECVLPNDLWKANHIIENFDTFLKKNDKPCDEMLVLTIDSVNNNPNPKPKDIAIKFIYSEQIYEEIEYRKAIGGLSWISNVGGFVGIFLGYSMMQFPEFLIYAAAVFNGELRKRVKGKLSSEAS